MIPRNIPDEIIDLVRRRTGWGGFWAGVWVGAALGVVVSLPVIVWILTRVGQ